jgi:DnaK suppressor protein
MSDIRRRLDDELETTVARLRPPRGGGAAIAWPPPAEHDGAFADEIDGSLVSAAREIDFATRERLVTRARRLVAALDRLHAGEYGTCVECSAPIAAARLQAFPEAQTCVRCEDRLERSGAASGRDGANVFPERMGRPIDVGEWSKVH